MVTQNTRITALTLALGFITAASFGQSILQVPSQYPSIQAAHDAAQTWDTIEVAPGVYAESLWLTKHVFIVGTGARPDDVVIDGSSGLGATITCDNVPNAGGPEASVRNLTVANGAGWAGGGLDIRFSDFHILECIVRDNTATDGAGVGGYSSAVWIVDCDIRNNAVSGGNGYDGGAVSFGQSDVWIVRTRIHDNTGQDVGGIRVQPQSQFELQSCLVTGNTGGSATILVESGSQLTVYNSTIVDNQAASGAAVAIDDSAGTGVYESVIIRNNTANGAAIPQIGSGGTATHSNIQGIASTSGNIDADPAFFPGSHHLRPGSPCIDAGSPSSSAWGQDLDGDVRIQGAAVDMGADEFQPCTRPGTGEDLTLYTQVNGLLGPTDCNKSATAGDILTLSVESLTGTFAFETLFVAGEVFTTGTAGPAGWPGFPALHVHPTSAFFLSGFGPLTQAQLSPMGLHLVFTLPPQLVGSTLRIQAAAASSLAANGLFAASDAHDLAIQ